MRKIILPLLVLSAIVFFPACSEKFDVAAPYKSVTVVYGLLDRNDTAHYIRIQKAFLDNNKSALAMAKEVDSNFYKNINVRVAKIPFSGIGLPSDTIHLNKVDLANEGYPKDQGTFFNSPNYAYKFTQLLDPNYTYRIIVTNAATGEVDSAETPVIDDKTNSNFYIYYIDDTSAHIQLDFTSTSRLATVNMQGKYTPPSSFTFKGSNTPVGIAQGFIRFHWIDSNIATGAKIARSCDHDFGYAPINNNNFAYSVPNLELYNAISSGFGPAPDLTVRLIDRCELIFYLGTSDFYNYLTVQSLQGTGLTGNEIQPSYTNIQGANVLGLYTARAMRSGYITISNSTINVLETNSLTESARIKGTVYH